MLLLMLRLMVVIDVANGTSASIDIAECYFCCYASTVATASAIVDATSAAVNAVIAIVIVSVDTFHTC